MADWWWGRRLSVGLGVRPALPLRSCPRKRASSAYSPKSWVPASAGTSGVRCSLKCFIDSTIKQPSVIARIVWRAPGSPVFLCPLWMKEGDGAPRGATILVRTLRCGRVWRDPRAPRRSIAVPFRRGPRFRQGLDRLTPSASSWRGVLVSPGGAPRRPGAGSAFLPARRHRIADAGFTRYRPR